jgi:hypothetical protein
MKLLWKLKGLILFLVLIAGVVFVLKGVMTKAKQQEAAMKAPEVAPANQLRDDKPSKASKAPLLSLGTDQWVQLEGTFGSTGETDRYSLAIADGTTGYEVQTWLRKQGKIAAHVGLGGVNKFPLTITSFDKAGKVLTNQLLAASGGGAKFPAGTARVDVVISGIQSDAQYAAGAPYIVYLRGSTAAAASAK